MDIERALETQRLRLLRVIAGLVSVVLFVSVGPFSREFPRWVSGFVLSILTRAESAAQCLVIAHAGLIAIRIGSDVDRRRLFDYPVGNFADHDSEVSLSHLHRRLQALLALLEDLPRHGLRLLRRAKKRMQRAKRTHHRMPCPDIPMSKMPGDWQLAGNRIERPPDKGNRHDCCEKTSPRYRAGGESGWDFGKT